MILTLGFDEKEEGTATLDGEEVVYGGERPDVVRRMLEGRSKLRGAALLRWADETYNGRMWASLEEPAAEEEPTENSNPEGCNQYTGPNCAGNDDAEDENGSGIGDGESSVEQVMVPRGYKGYYEEGHEVVALHKNGAPPYAIASWARQVGRTNGEVKGLLVGQDVYLWDEEVHHDAVAKVLGKKVPAKDRFTVKLVGGEVVAEGGGGWGPLEDSDLADWLRQGGRIIVNQVIANEWVTLDGGQRVFIGEGGKVQPGGPGSKPVSERTQKGKDLHPSPSPKSTTSYKPKGGQTVKEEPGKTVPKTLKEELVEKHKDAFKEKAPVAKHAPEGSKPVDAPTDPVKDPESSYWRDQAPESAKGFYGAIKAKLAGAAKDFYDSLPNDTADGGLGPTVGGAAQRLIDGAAWLERQLGGAYDAGQRLAHAVAKERGLSDADANRTARMLASADAVSRWTSWKVAESFGAAVGGPVGYAAAAGAAKLSFYVPAASLAYVGYSLGREAFGGRNPLTLISKARARVRNVRRKGMARNASSKAYTDLKDWAAAVADWLATVEDPDGAEATLAAALDEARGDKTLALRLAQEAHQDESPTANLSTEEAIDEVADAWEQLLEDNPGLTEDEQDTLLDQLLGSNLAGNSNRSLDSILNAGANCGTGAGGFQPGNTCASGADAKDAYDLAGSPSVPNSKVNKQLRDIMAMPKADAAKVIADLKRKPVGDPRKQLADMILDRRNSYIRVQAAGGVNRKSDAAARARVDKMNDEPLIKPLSPARSPKGQADPLAKPRKAVEKAQADVAKAKTKLAKAQATLRSARADMAKVKAAIKARVPAKPQDPAKVKAFKAASQQAERLYARAATGKLKPADIKAHFASDALKKAPLADLRALAKKLDTYVTGSSKTKLLAGMASTVDRRNGAKQRVDA